MGVVEEVGPQVTELRPGDRVVIPFNVSCGTCFMCGQRPALPVRDHAGARARQGRGAVRLHEALRPGTGRPGRVPARPVRQHAPRSRFPRGRRTTGSSTSPTCCRRRGRRSSTPPSRRAASVVVLGLGPIGDMATRIALHRGAEKVIGVDLVPERLERARARGVTALDLTGHGRHLGDYVRELTDGRGPDAVVDAVGMEAHGSPVGEARPAAHGHAAGRTGGAVDGDGRHRPAERAPLGDRAGAPRRHDLDQRRLRRHWPTRCRC